MSSVRALERDDLSAVANLLVGAFMSSDRPAGQALVRYLGDLFLDFPDRDPDIHSLVYVDNDSRVIGFIGALSQTMAYQGRTLRMAIANSFAVEKRSRDPMAAPHLLRAFLRGPQDLSLSDRANETSLAMWRTMRGPTLPYYSLDWLRVLHPTGYAVARLAEHNRLANALNPIAGGVDQLIERGSRKSRWTVAPLRSTAGLTVEDVDDDTLLDVIPGLVADIALHPVWTEAGLRQVLRDAAHKSTLGTLIRQVVRDRSGAVVGAYLYHTRPHGIAQTLHVLPARGQTVAVLDCLLADAHARGAVAMGGRAQPGLLEPLMDRRATFTSRQRCLIGSKDPRILATFENGDAVVTGLVGEYWTRLNGDGLR